MYSGSNGAASESWEFSGQAPVRNLAVAAIAQGGISDWQFGWVWPVLSVSSTIAPCQVQLGDTVESNSALQRPALRRRFGGSVKLGRNTIPLVNSICRFIRGI